MCLKTSKTLLIDAPAINTAKLSRILPAGYLPPRAIGCDFHSNDSSPQLVQCWFTITMVPRCFMVTLGPLFLQVKQNSENNANSFEKNTMNFGSSWAGNPGSTLKLLNIIDHELFSLLLLLVLVIAIKFSKQWTPEMFQEWYYSYVAQKSQ